MAKGGKTHASQRFALALFFFSLFRALASPRSVIYWEQKGPEYHCHSREVTICVWDFFGFGNCINPCCGAEGRVMNVSRLTSAQAAKVQVSHH